MLLRLQGDSHQAGHQATAPAGPQAAAPAEHQASHQSAPAILICNTEAMEAVHVAATLGIPCVVLTTSCSSASHANSRHGQLQLQPGKLPAESKTSQQGLSTSSAMFQVFLRLLVSGNTLATTLRICKHAFALIASGHNCAVNAPSMLHHWLALWVAHGYVTFEEFEFSRLNSSASARKFGSKSGHMISHFHHGS